MRSAVTVDFSLKCQPDTFQAQGNLSDNAGHSGTGTLNSQSNGSVNGRTRQSWRQAGDGTWTVTADWFTATEKSNSNGNYHEHDNGLNATLLPGEVGTFINCVNATSTSNQTLTETGASNNYAFTFQLNTNTLETADNSSNVSSPKKHRGAIVNISGSEGKIATIIETGQQINDEANVSNVTVYQLVMNSTAEDGFSYGPGVTSTGHTRMTIGYATDLAELVPRSISVFS